MSIKIMIKKSILFVLVVLATLLAPYATEHVTLEEVGIAQGELLCRGYKIHRDSDYGNMSKKEFISNARQGLATGYHHMVYAIQEDKVVGSVQWSLRRELYWGWHSHIDSLVVGNQHRDRGIDKLLIAWVKKQGTELKSEKVCLETALDNLGAQRFYEREGFKQLGAIEYGFNPNEL